MEYSRVSPQNSSNRKNDNKERGKESCNIVSSVEKWLNFEGCVESGACARGCVCVCVCVCLRACACLWCVSLCVYVCMYVCGNRTAGQQL